MKGYWIAFVDIQNKEQYDEYLAIAPSALKAFGAKILARSDELTALEGFISPPHRAVVLEFESYELAIACYNSPAYKNARSLRDNAAQAQVVIMKGTEC